MSNSFVDTVFLPQFYDKLGARKDTFLKMFKYLESLNKDSYFIIETGTTRKDSMDGDGSSTILFDEFAKIYPGTKVISIDICKHHCDYAKTRVSDTVEIICSDSTLALFNIAKDNSLPNIDLLYLDSFDMDWGNPHPSSMHHIKEFISIQPKLAKGSLVVVDDNANNKGKGQYISEYMVDINQDKYFDEYQIGWVL